MTEEVKDEEVKEEEPKFVQILREKNERTYRFVMPVGAPLGEAFDVSVEVSNQIASLAKQATAKLEETEKEKEKEE